MLVTTETSHRAVDPSAPSTCRVTVVMEWANTILNGVSRARLVLDELARQWREVTSGPLPDLPGASRTFLGTLSPRLELLVVSGASVDAETAAWILDRDEQAFDTRILVAEGLEYYPLKNHGLAQVSGDVVMFIDSDVVPDDHWLAHLLGSFGDPDIHAVTGQPYVRPTDLFSRAFALGWTYDRRRAGTGLMECPKFYANNVAFRTAVLGGEGFPDIGRATRGAATRLRDRLGERGALVWQHRSAAVDHPPPASARHMFVRALAHGRDIYMAESDRRSWWAVWRSVGRAASRWWRGCLATVREGRDVGLKTWQMPACMAIISAYYVAFALGGVFTFVSPAAAGRRFRV